MIKLWNRRGRVNLEWSSVWVVQLDGADIWRATIQNCGTTHRKCSHPPNCWFISRYRIKHLRAFWCRQIWGCGKVCPNARMTLA